MEIFHENFLVLLRRHYIKKTESPFFYTFETIFDGKVFILPKMTSDFDFDLQN